MWRALWLVSRCGGTLGSGWGFSLGVARAQVFSVRSTLLQRATFAAHSHRFHTPP